MRPLRFHALLALLTLAACVSDVPPDQRARFEAGQAAQHQFELQLFVRAGFAPLSELAAARRAVRRVLFSDPFFILSVPGVEIERRGDGTLTLTVEGRGVTTEPSAIPRAAWPALARDDAVIFRPAVYKPWSESRRAGYPPLPPPTCHGWLVRLAMTDSKGEKSASAGQCGGMRDQAGMAYAAKIARLAVATRPGCSFTATDPFWSFARCFAPQPH